MTVTTLINRNDYTGNGSVSSYPYQFKIFSDSDLEVYQIDTNENSVLLTLNVDYTVTGSGDATGGTVELSFPLPSNFKLAIVRVLPLTQQTAFRNQGSFYPARHEDALDRAIMIIQQLQEQLDRVVLTPVETTPGTSYQIPPPDPDHLIGWNVAGTALENKTDISELGMADLASQSDSTKGTALIGVLPSAVGSGMTLQEHLSMVGLMPENFGAVGDGATDDTLALQRWATSGSFLIGSPKTFLVSETIEFPVGIQLDGRGMQIDGSAGGTWTLYSVVLVRGSLTALPALASSITEGDISISFDSAHSLVENDVCCIYNPTNYSWSNARTYYRAGEFFRVGFISSSTALKSCGNINHSYVDSAVSLYKLEKNEVSFMNLTCIAPDSGSIAPLKIVHATKVNINNYSGYGSDYTSLVIDKCYDVSIYNSKANVTVQVVSSKYGIALGNSQNVNIIGCDCFAVRHAINIGGDDAICCVPNRFVTISNCYLASDSALTNVPCADIHGNSANVIYINNTIKGGATLSGYNASYINNNFDGYFSNTGSVIYGASECVGGVFKVIGNTIKGNGTYSYGVISIGMTHAQFDLTLIVDNNSVYADNATEFIRGYHNISSNKLNIVCNNVQFIYAPDIIDILRVSGDGSNPSDGDFIVVDNIFNAPSGARLVYLYNQYGANVRCRLMRQAGIATINTVALDTVDTVSVTFRYSYGTKTPSVTVTANDYLVGTQPIAACVTARSVSAFTAAIFTCSGSGFGAVEAQTINYSAEYDAS